MKAKLIQPQKYVLNQASKMQFGDWGLGFVALDKNPGLFFRGRNETIFFPEDGKTAQFVVAPVASDADKFFFVQEILPKGTCFTIEL